MAAPLTPRVRTSQLQNSREADQKGPDARRRPRAAREAYCLYVERAAAGANEADGPFSPASPAVEPDVPEVHVGAWLVPLYVLASCVEPEVVADLDARRLGVEHRLDLLPHGVALLVVEFAAHGLQERVLLDVAPPSRPLAEHLRGRCRHHHET